jgi:AraC-like DNA-binding protein
VPLQFDAEVIDAAAHLSERYLSSMMKGGLAVCAHITAGQTRLAARRLARTNTLSSSRY